MIELLNNLKSSHILKGDSTHAYRDPAVIYKDGIFYIYFTFVETEEDGSIFMYVAFTKTTDFTSFSPVKKLTVRDKTYNFSSPGNIVFHDGKYKMCVQTYCRENGEKYGNENSRIYLMESEDLEHWSFPEIMMVKGDLPVAKMGRMIDPYLIYDSKTMLWNCFFKQNGVSRSVSKDLKEFVFMGSLDCGENVSVLKSHDGYYLFHSPANGIGVKFSHDLTHWEDTGTLLTFGQKEWPWAQGRLTAGTVIEITDNGKPLYLMLFHGSGPQDESVIFDTYAGIGIAWSTNLKNWIWK